MEYLAHIAEDGRVQTIYEHLTGTAAIAAEFGAPFGAADEARFAGMLHDIGKYSAEFQRRLRGGAAVDHSTAGAQEAFRRGDLPAALAIAGHHGGIPDCGNRNDQPDNATLQGRIKREIPSCREWQSEITAPHAAPAAWVMTDCITGAFYTRMLYSCLVDADFQDTQNFMDGKPAPRGEGAAISALLGKMRAKAAEYLSSTSNKVVTTQRNTALRACMERGAQWAQGMYTLTVPTGGGKTFASLAFALEHAAAHGMTRVIYVIPYTSIIDQTADVFSELLGEENVLAHYSAAEYRLVEADGLTPAQYRKLLASENWDAPVVVTTAVQFFESLYANRSSRCRKLHNIANSVIIFDEAQTLPQDYLMPCLSAIAQLTQHYNVTSVLCTATQPSLAPLFAQLAPELSQREICPDVAGMYDALRRTEIRDLGSVATDVLTERLCAHKQVLCVVNRRKTAQELYSALPPEGSYCLTTLLCAADRKRQLAEIRSRLSSGLDCRVVSTSLIEAGVDVDFPVAYREQCGLDSLLQTAGRCNREGKNAPADSPVYRFRLEGEAAPQMLAQNISAADYTARRHIDLAAPDAIKTYFNELFNLKDSAVLDKKQILPMLKNGIGGCMLPFAQVAEQFRIIETPTRTVYIPIGDGEELCRKLRSGEISRALLRRLGIYSVECYAAQFKALDDAGALELLPDGSTILADMTKYDRETGLALNAETGIGLFI